MQKTYKCVHTQIRPMYVDILLCLCVRVCAHIATCWFTTEFGISNVFLESGMVVHTWEARVQG